MKTHNARSSFFFVALVTMLGIPLSSTAQVLLSNTEFAVLGGTAAVWAAPAPIPS